MHKDYGRRPTVEDTLGYISAFTRASGFPPSVREIGNQFDVSRQTAVNMLNELVEQGLLKRVPGIGRGIQITGAGMKQIGTNL